MAKHAAAADLTDVTQENGRTTSGSDRREHPAHRLPGGFIFRGFDPSSSTMRVDFQEDADED